MEAEDREKHEALGLLFVVYQKAAGRFMTGGERPGLLVQHGVRHLEDPETYPDPSQDRITYADVQAALANALRAARPVDRALSERLGGHAWWRDLAPTVGVSFAPDADITPAAVPGFRYARNAIEHDGADLVAYRGGGPPKRADRTTVPLFDWAPFEDAGRSSGAASYRDELVGKPIFLTLVALSALFAQGWVRAVERDVEPG